jgi:hypothetical protein
MWFKEHLLQKQGKFSYYHNPDGRGPKVPSIFDFKKMSTRCIKQNIKKIKNCLTKYLIFFGLLTKMSFSMLDVNTVYVDHTFLIRFIKFPD